MDPDKALLELRAAFPILHNNWQPGENVDHDAIVETALAAAEALDDWLSKGGFLPIVWHR